MNVFLVLNAILYFPFFTISSKNTYFLMVHKQCSTIAKGSNFSNNLNFGRMLT